MATRQAIVDLIDAALNGELAVVELDRSPAGSARYPIEIHGPGLEAPLQLIAQIAGAEMHGAYPVVLFPTTPRQPERLRALAQRLRATESGPIPAGSGGEGAQGDRASAVAARVARETATTDTALDPPKVDRQDALLGATLGGGRYQIEELIGTGGMGRVYLGKQLALQRPVAIKVLDTRFESDTVFTGRFHQEALAASQLDHRNVTRVLDFGQEPNGRLYLVMELLKGERLAEVIDEAGFLPLDRMVKIMSQVCGALAAAHDQGVVHRDIKPDNIVVEARTDDDGNRIEHVKVCDFGLAKMLAEEQTAPAQPGARRRLTVAGQIMGTPDYMSPEQCRGQPADARSDIYACGVVLFEMCTGRVPFAADAPLEVLGMHLMSPPPRPTSLNRQMDPRVERIILKALEKEPEARHQTIRELRDELRALLHPSEAAIQPSMMPAPGSVLPSGRPASMTPAPQMRPSASDQPPLPHKSTPAMIAAKLQSSFPPASESVSKRLDGLARELDFGDSAEEVRPSLIPIDTESAPEAVRARSSIPPRNVDAHEVLPDARHLIGADATLHRPAYARLVGAGLSGYWALVRARDGQNLDTPARHRWIKTVRDLAIRGQSALADSLARLDTSQQRVDIALYEDLLAAIPEKREEASVDQVDRLLSHPSPLIRRAALSARVRMGGKDLKTPLLRALSDRDPGVQLVATRAYRKLGGVSAPEVQILSKIVSEPSAPDELRASSAIALVRTDARGRADAEIALLRALEARSPSFIRRLGGTRPPEDGPLFLEAAARALLRLSGPAVRPVIEKRARASKGEHRDRLERVLSSA